LRQTFLQGALILIGESSEREKENMRLTYKSQVRAAPAAADSRAVEFFADKLRCETDPADVHADMENGVDSFVVLDVRSSEDYERKHVPGAISLPHSRITQKRMSEFPDDSLFVVYCWGPGCNGSTKAALKLSQLGYAVKEMIGGIEYWEREGYPTAGCARQHTLETGERQT